MEPKIWMARGHEGILIPYSQREIYELAGYEYLCSCDY